MKKTRHIPIAVLIILTILIVGCVLVVNSFPLAELYIRFFPAASIVTEETITIEQTYYHAANDRQYNASVRMLCWENKLYFYPYRQVLLKRDAYYRKLCVFENGKVSKLSEQLDGALLGMRNGFFYYVEHVGWDGSLPESVRICAYNISSGQRTLLMDRQYSPHYCNLFFSDTDVLHISYDLYNTQYTRINNDQVIGETVDRETYLLGERMYYAITKGRGLPRVVCRNEEGVENTVFQVATAVESSFGELNILPCDAGLIIHNDGTGNLLYLISETDHSVRELLSFPCGYSESAVTVYGNYVYVSFLRYEYIPNIPYEEDDISGTYRINLGDFTTEKLSDHYYNGMFIFDDTGIYACDDGCNIYKLDFDGNVVMTLLEH